METLSTRERQILSHIVESYWNTGHPVGSSALAQQKNISLSSATLRHVMSDLEEKGFLYSPHISAGRLPTEGGLQYFVRNIMEVQDISGDDKRALCERIQSSPGESVEQRLNHFSTTLSQISRCAGIISAPRHNETLESLRFVPLSSRRVLLVLVMQDGRVENRVLELDCDLSSDILAQAERYVNAHSKGQTLSQTWECIDDHIQKDRASLSDLTRKLVKKGIHVIRSETIQHQFIVRGTANLIHTQAVEKDLAHMRELLSSLENHHNISELIDSALNAQGVQIFIGSENPLFAHSDSALVISPYQNAKGHVIGTIGVIGPSSYNYSKVIPIVNYTAQFLSQFFD